MGSSLIKEGDKIAKELGYNYSIVLGDKEYYSRYGYEEASSYGVVVPFEVTSENFMIYKLEKGGEEIKGVVQYAEEFFTV